MISIFTPDIKHFYLYILFKYSNQSLFFLALVSSSCSSWTLRLFEVEVPCSPHLSPCPCPSSCQGPQESPPQERASLDRKPCSVGQRCRYECLPSAGAGNQRSLVGPEGHIKKEEIIKLKKKKKVTFFLKKHYI